MIIHNTKTKKPSTVRDIFEYLMKTPRSWTFFPFKIILFAKFREVHYTLETVSHHKPSFVREYSATCHIVNFPFGVLNVIKQCLSCFCIWCDDLFISMSASANIVNPTFPPCSHGKHLLRMVLKWYRNHYKKKKNQCEHSGVVLAYH